MSLLNEMLHDLAKQKHTKQATHLYMPVPFRNKGGGKKVLLGLALVAFTLFLFLLHKHSAKMNFQATQSVSEAEINSFDATIKLEPIAQAAVTTVLEPVNLVSYIEPLASVASQRVVIQLPTATDALSNWVDNQGEPSAAVINKVYTPQTIEEWHDAQLNKALEAIDKGFDQEAITLLREILIRVPNASDVRENLASLYLTYGDFAQAAEIVNEGLRYTPTDTALITIKARLFLDQGKAMEAINLLSKYRPSMMSYPDFYGTLAAALQSEGRILESGSIYRSLIQIDPNDGRYWLGYAIALEHNNKVNQAIEAYLRASQNPESEPTVRDYAENRLKVLQG
ncbi:tetratricopeptide repeat protein [Fluoribacter gormanii]|uniref:MSHA biogenesis protein MshN n=1 Tax=Fluoribacter gormanii TaxID=464 RepID=A0A377GLV9_9GAMM|nr:tetratricopeptide repeat protein [Fluoribacter gormanii]KTD05586.1 Tetratricopeptide repeat protein [Fluoribacter gormanii]MCW8442630.1 tetratricopeptide repeat protein [Fluoribacter gormanii]SIQ68259.1 MSHA biogenesis protein MshN [Fluoribacter gormanii]STO25761.1 Predicted O-linked N-acetylglucosamine transferase, SPINDLY family [Fluoribacter gormanii]